MFVDPRVQLKRQYLDESRGSGNLWYNQQAYRAVNQAIGRVIRHRTDYGAIIFLDERFTQPGSIAQLPKWLKCYVNKVTEFGRAMYELKGFFKIATDKFPCKVPSL